MPFLALSRSHQQNVGRSPALRMPRQHAADLLTQGLVHRQDTGVGNSLLMQCHISRGELT